MYEIKVDPRNGLVYTEKKAPTVKVRHNASRLSVCGPDLTGLIIKFIYFKNKNQLAFETFGLSTAMARPLSPSCVGEHSQ